VQEDCPMYCLQDKYKLVDKCQQKYRIYTDDNCRNYLFYPFDLCLFPYLARLSSWGIKSIRIDGNYYSAEKLLRVVGIYAEALQHIKTGQWAMQEKYAELLAMFPEGLSTSIFSSNVEGGFPADLVRNERR
jgi:U32 family peptidase